MTVRILPEAPDASRTPHELWEQDMQWVFRDPFLVGRHETVCPVWGDTIPYKSVTVVVPPELENHAAHCLACAHGGDYARRQVLEDGRVAIRSDYQCW